MPHAATRVLPLRSIPPVTSIDRDNPAIRAERPFLGRRATIPPELDAAHGVIMGVVCGLLIWVGLLLPVLYVLL